MYIFLVLIKLNDHEMTTGCLLDCISKVCLIHFALNVDFYLRFNKSETKVVCQLLCFNLHRKYPSLCNQSISVVSKDVLLRIEL